MNPELFYFGFLYNVRNFLLALVPIVLSSYLGIQVLGLMTIFVVWLLSQMHYLPWRFPILNYFDAFTSGANMLLLTCFAMLGGGTSLSQESIGWCAIFIFLMTIVTLTGTAAVKIINRFLRQKYFGIFLCHAKAAAGLFARQIKMMINWTTKRKVFLDVDELENLDNLNFTVRSNTDNLFILMTSEIFTRFSANPSSGLPKVVCALKNVV